MVEYEMGGEDSDSRSDFPDKLKGRPDHQASRNRHVVKRLNFISVRETELTP